MECSGRKPVVSIIIPCFNGDRSVRRAINSALSQTFRYREVIVIDDGSTDDSLQVLRSFDEAIRWETGPNRGACAARNRGLELARGEFVQFLDADDVLHPYKIERQIHEMQLSGADLVYCDGQVVKNDKVVKIYARECRGMDPVCFTLEGALPTPQPLHQRRYLLSIGGFREDLPCAQERDLHLRLACSGLRFHRLPEILVTIHRSPGSLSSDTVKVLDQHARIAMDALRLLEAAGRLDDARARALAGFLAIDARAYLRHGRNREARDYFKLAEQIHHCGGVSAAYNLPTRLLRRALGAVATEYLVRVKRRVLNRC